MVFYLSFRYLHSLVCIYSIRLYVLFSSGYNLPAFSEIGDLLNFQKGHIMGASLAEASVTLAAKLLLQPQSLHS